MSSDRPKNAQATPPAPAFLCETVDGLVLTVKAQPRASRNKLGELAGTEWKIWVTAPPVDSAANSAILEFLADELGLARSQVELVRGETSRHKTILLRGMTAVRFLASPAFRKEPLDSNDR